MTLIVSTWFVSDSDLVTPVQDVNVTSVQGEPATVKSPARLFLVDKPLFLDVHMFALTYGLDIFVLAQKLFPEWKCRILLMLTPVRGGITTTNLMRGTNPQVQETKGDIPLGYAFTTSAMQLSNPTLRFWFLPFPFLT